MESVQAFMLALLDVGDRLTRLVDNLIEGYVESAGCSEDEATAEILTMIFGTTSVRLATVPPADFERATELLRRAFTVVLADVEAAAELARRRELPNHATSTHGRPL
ncbi:hypothetical protein DVA67_017785 [Solirubrobacter sp. CPCC 204708]|uniref:Uncharacterized protein n=1 Tax=Solirubrobacter deserti TaxID=2282478 RepID=A0ABT4RCZ2_9ACTN|nr:hypothetical protein [Solirubrobacter deserti]MBE2317838.1 hypothetical protein [Solirubrobacter deserti]MDA0136385.1 hypothetical protein [Solirubrobacter deserti]